MVENLINDLLDLAKLENQSFTIDQKYFSLTDTITQALQMLVFRANQLEIKLTAEISN